LAQSEPDRPELPTPQLALDVVVVR